MSSPRRLAGGRPTRFRGGTMLRVPAGTGSAAGERGATLALVAVFLGALLGVLALVIDLGGAWHNRRELIPATDAAALAVAQELVERPWNSTGACSIAAAYLAENAPGAELSTCRVVPDAISGGMVEIGASRAHAGIVLAIGDALVESRSSAAWGPPLTMSGLRPLALCYGGPLRQLIDQPPATPTPISVDLLSGDGSACGGVGFSTVDFEGDGQLWELRSWLRDGYSGELSFDEPTGTCSGDAVCHRRAYALLDLLWDLAALKTSGRYVALPIYDYADLAEVHLVGVVRARLLDVDLIGDLGSWSLLLEIDPGLVIGDCCGPGGITGGNMAIALCDVGSGSAAVCEPEDAS